MRRKLNLAGAMIVAAAITYFSFTAGSGAGAGPGGRSPLLHAFAYFGLSLSLLLYFDDSKSGHFKAFLLAFLYGFGIELLQGMTAYRFFGWLDVAANAAGASIIMLDTRTHFYRNLIEFEDYFLNTLEARIPN